MLEMRDLFDLVRSHEVAKTDRKIILLPGLNGLSIRFCTNCIHNPSFAADADGPQNSVGTRRADAHCPWIFDSGRGQSVDAKFRDPLITDVSTSGVLYIVYRPRCVGPLPLNVWLSSSCNWWPVCSRRSYFKRLNAAYTL